MTPTTSSDSQQAAATNHDILLSLPSFLRDETLSLDSFKRCLKCFLFADTAHEHIRDFLMIMRYINVHLIIIIIIIIIIPYTAKLFIRSGYTTDVIFSYIPN